MAPPPSRASCCTRLGARSNAGVRPSAAGAEGELLLAAERLPRARHPQPNVGAEHVLPVRQVGDVDARDERPLAVAAVRLAVDLELDGRDARAAVHLLVAHELLQRDLEAVVEWPAGEAALEALHGDVAERAHVVGARGRR